MSKTNHTKKCSCPFQPFDLTRWVVRPLSRRLTLHHRVCIEQGKRLRKQIEELNDSVEIIAREIARWSQRGE